VAPDPAVVLAVLHEPLARIGEAEPARELEARLGEPRLPCGQGIERAAAGLIPVCGLLRPVDGSVPSQVVAPVAIVRSPTPATAGPGGPAGGPSGNGLPRGLLRRPARCVVRVTAEATWRCLAPTFVGRSDHPADTRRGVLRTAQQKHAPPVVRNGA